MRFVPVKTPWILKSLYSDYIWDIRTDEKVLYLTFDDGPTPEITEFVLETLQQYKAMATFFCIGANIQKYPKLFKHVVTGGHSVGNHTQNHVKGWQTKLNEYLREVEQAQTMIKYTKSQTHPPNLNSKLFRPPYGQITKAQGQKILSLDYQIIMWDVLSFDWSAEVSEEKCLKNVLSKSKPGSIVTFHDSLKASRNLNYVLPKFLEYFSEIGFQFKPIDYQLLRG